jgi:hypothetical protein
VYGLPVAAFYTVGDANYQVVFSHYNSNVIN